MPSKRTRRCCAPLLEGKVTSPAAEVGHFLEAGARFSPSFEKDNLICREWGGGLVIVVQAQRTNRCQPHRLWNRM